MDFIKIDNHAEVVPVYQYYTGSDIHHRQIFSGGVSDQNEN